MCKGKFFNLKPKLPSACWFLEPIKIPVKIGTHADGFPSYRDEILALTSYCDFCFMTKKHCFMNRKR